MATSRLFRLPAELRNAIYKHVLVEEKPNKLPYAYEKISFREPAFLRASRPIYVEAAPLYYGSNIFEAPSPASAHRFLSPLDPQCISWIRKFRPFDQVLPLSAHRRWFEALCAINRLVLVCGKGTLSSDSIFVPIRKEYDGVGWYQVEDVKSFRVVHGYPGIWRLESSEEVEQGADSLG